MLACRIREIKAKIKNSRAEGWQPRREAIGNWLYYRKWTEEIKQG